MRYIYCVLFLTPFIAFADLAGGIERLSGFMLNVLFPLIATIGVIVGALIMLTMGKAGFQKAVWCFLATGVAFAGQSLISMFRGWFS